MKTYVAIAKVRYSNDDVRELIFYAGSNLKKAQDSFTSPKNGLNLDDTVSVYFKTVQLWEKGKFVMNVN